MQMCYGFGVGLDIFLGAGFAVDGCVDVSARRHILDET